LTVKSECFWRSGRYADWLLFGVNIKLPTNEFDKNPIYDVKMIPIDQLNLYGFSDKFKEVVINAFSKSGGRVRTAMSSTLNVKICFKIVTQV